MAIIRGNWWAQATRPLIQGIGDIDSSDLATSSVTTGKLAVGAVTTGILADGAITTGKFATGAITTGDIADGSITAAKIVDAAVLSEKASTYLSRRTFSGLLIAPASTVDGGYSSAYILWQPAIPINIQSVDLITRGVYENATGDAIDFFGNAGTSIGGISLTTSTSYAAGSRFAMTPLVQTALAAATPMVAKVTASTCSKMCQMEVIVDYRTTG